MADSCNKVWKFSNDGEISHLDMVVCTRRFYLIFLLTSLTLHKIFLRFLPVGIGYMGYVPLPLTL